MRAVIACVEFDDYLAVSLPAWQQVLDPEVHLVVVTAPHDIATKAVATECAVPVIETMAWDTDGASFNLAAFALARYAQSPQVDPRIARRAGGAGHQILLHLQAQAGGQDNPLADVEACAAIVYAGLEHPRSMQDPAIRPLLVAAAERTIDTFAADEGFAPRDPAGGPRRPRSPNAQALVAAALSRLIQRGYGRDRLTPPHLRPPPAPAHRRAAGRRRPAPATPGRLRPRPAHTPGRPKRYRRRLAGCARTPTGDVVALAGLG